MKARVVIPTGYRKLATGSYVETGDYCLQATIDGCGIELEWKQSTNVNFPWRVTHSVFVIRSRSRKARSGGEQTTNNRSMQAEAASTLR